MPVLLQEGLSDYEKQRLKNIEENKKMLESLGLLRTFKPILQPVKKKNPVSAKKPKPAVKRSVVEVESPSENGTPYKRRRSLRVKGIEPDGTMILPDEDEKDDEYKPRTPKIRRENCFGSIEGIPIGTHWETRMECSADGVHRPTVAGIHGNESVGCYSIALSGGYEDDIDLGESFTYTGSGGRDLKGTSANPKNLRTAPQSKDQTLTKMNLALSLNAESCQPVRVIRGYKLQSPFAPEYGYRYDGLYTVEKFWSCVGLSGFLVWKYILKRVPNQAPPPWLEKKEDDSSQDSSVDVASQESKTKDEDEDESGATKEKVKPSSSLNGSSGYDVCRKLDLTENEEQVHLQRNSLQSENNDNKEDQATGSSCNTKMAAELEREE